MPGPVHFFVHVPKCAGSTVEEHFRRHLGAAFLIAPRWESPLREILGNRPPSGLGPTEHVRAVSGHSLARSFAHAFPGRELREYVLLRDPIGYLLSFYNYRVDRHEEHGEIAPPPFPEWLRAQRRNGISRFLLHRYFGVGYPALYGMGDAGRLAFLERRLRSFRFVGGHRRCTEMVAAASREMGLHDEVEDSNVTRRKAVRREDLGAELEARILREHALDAALHARWRDRGFDADHDPGPPPDLGGSTGAGYLASDALTAIRKKMWR